MNLQRLREETAVDHAATETAVPLMGAGLTRDSYVENLRCFFRVVSAWDAWADANVPDDLRAMLAERRRATLLRDDLRTMDAQVTETGTEELLQRMQQTTTPGDRRAVFLGRMYVMEGSTLGGQLLARHVEDTLNLRPGEGDSYFRGYGDHTGERWKQFRALLEALPEHDADTVIASAKNMFALFGEGMQG